jgi:hypothetical protein
LQMSSYISKNTSLHFSNIKSAFFLSLLCVKSFLCRKFFKHANHCSFHLIS